MNGPARLALAAAALAGSTLAVREGVRRILGIGTGEDLDDWRGPHREDVDVGSARIDLPIQYRDDDCFMAVFAADAAAVTAALPSDRLKPVRLGDGRAALAIVAYDYRDTSVGPYGEVGVAVMCTLDRTAPPVLPALLESRWPGFGAFVTHLPVTTTIARDAGRAVWGYPKFVADMDFEHGDRRAVSLSEGGASILDLVVHARGPAIRDNRPLVTYSVRGGDLVRTTVPMHARYRLGAGGSGQVALGDHPVAVELRSWGIDPVAMFTKTYVERRAVLPDGVVVGPADRPYGAYEPAPLAAGREA